jgi:AcrR family transcriptional regulator
MRLSAPDRRQKLQTAALELFSRQGFRGTTTLQIARAAGVSEALLFRHFSSKEDLYWSVLEAQCADRRGTERLEALFQSGGDDLEVFSAIAEDILVRNFADARLYRLLLFSALENHELSHRFFDTYISEYYESVAAHIRGRIEAGVFRTVDPLLSARLFIGMSLHYFLVEQLFKGREHSPADLQRISRTAAEAWLRGVTGEAPTEANGNGAHRLPRKPSKPYPAPKLEEALIRR